MEMLNERAIRIIEEIPIKTDEQKAALELATEALKRYKCIELAPLDDKAFTHLDKIRSCIFTARQKKTWTRR